MKPYSIYGTGREAAFIELIDRMLRESHDYISTTMVLELYKKKKKRQYFSKAINRKKIICCQKRNRIVLKEKGIGF